MGFPGSLKKGVEMGRYYGSEALRNPKIQKKALDFALDQLSPMIHNVGSQALDELSTKIRPKKNYKTNRKDLDGAGVDIHKMIGKLPKPKGGFILPGHKYTTPYNDLDSQVRLYLIPSQARSLKYTTNPQAERTPQRCSMILIILFAKTTGHAKIEQIGKW